MIDRLCEGWFTGARAYGMPRRRARWSHINGYLYFGSTGEEYAGDEALVARAVVERWWVREYERWTTEEKPAAVARNLELQGVDVAALDDAALASHVGDALRHLLDVGPLHFAHRGRQLVRDELRKQAEAEGVAFDDLTAAFAGGSPASSRPALLLAGIADAMREGGADAGLVRELDDVRSVPAAAVLLDAYLEEFGHRLLESYDLACSTLHERPDVLAATIRAAASGRRLEPATVQLPEMSEGLRALLDEARRSEGTEDDDDGVCIFWPSGLLRRALLELARRRGLVDAAAIFEVDVDELDRLLDAGDDAPDDEVLAERLAFRRRVAAVTPPGQVGGDAPPLAPPDARGDERLTGTGVGDGVARGRACVVTGLDSAGLADLEPGDVLIAVTTNPGYNAVMPLLAAVATELDLGHTVICARELGIPAVVGVRGLIDAIPHLAMVEVDAARGVVRLLD